MSSAATTISLTQAARFSSKRGDPPGCRSATVPGSAPAQRSSTASRLAPARLSAPPRSSAMMSLRGPWPSAFRLGLFRRVDAHGYGYLSRRHEAHEGHEDVAPYRSD